jgi:hypothetical protein
MAKKVLLALLLLSFLIEAFLSSAGFVSTDWMLGQFKLSATPDTRFLAYALAWLLLFVGLIVGLSFILVRKGNSMGWLLSYLLGFWWVGIGIGIYIAFQRPDNLVLDSAKGALILLFARLSHPARIRS